MFVWGGQLPCHLGLVERRNYVAGETVFAILAPPQGAVSIRLQVDVRLGDQLVMLQISGCSSASCSSPVTLALLQANTPTAPLDFTYELVVTYPVVLLNASTKYAASDPAQGWSVRWEARVMNRPQFCQVDRCVAQGNCGLCPLGYSSDGLSCVSCQATWTCDRYGKPACPNRCKPGEISRCDGDTGTVACTPSSVDTALPENARVTRGGFNDFDASGHLYPYFECNTGFYLHFLGTGDVECAPCDASIAQPTSVWASPWLLVQSDWSCLWACAPYIARLSNAAGC